MNRSFAIFVLLALSFAMDAFCGVLTDPRDGQTYRTVKIGITIKDSKGKIVFKMMSVVMPLIRL